MRNRQRHRRRERNRETDVQCRQTDRNRDKLKQIYSSIEKDRQTETEIARIKENEEQTE